MNMKKAFPELNARLRTWWEGVSTSYWFIPVCMMVIALVLWFFCLTIIERTELPQWLLSLIPLVTGAGAQQILSTIATSIITVTSIAFSMTVVALTLASSQFGPRLLRTFMLDRGTQFVLGLLVSTFLFCLISLHHLTSMTDNQDAVSLLSGLSVLLAIADILAIIYFIHHIGRFIQADEVIYRCYHELMSNISTLLPEPEAASEERAVPEELLPDAAHSQPVIIKRSGYVQTVNYEKLLNCSIDGVEGIEVRARSGDHVLPGATLLLVHSRYPINEDELRTLLDLVILGNRRTPVQDPEFAIGQMVELALRALSPGINDPVTAISCLDRLTACCIFMAERDFPADCVVNTDSGLWLKRRTFSLEGIINRAFDQIRQDGRDHLDIALHILFCLKSLNKHLPATHRPIVKKQAQATYELIIESPLSDKDRYILQSAYTPFM